MLVVYSAFSVLNYSTSNWTRLPDALIAGVITAGLQYFFRNPLLSIIAGTAAYMLLR